MDRHDGNDNSEPSSGEDGGGSTQQPQRKPWQEDDWGKSQKQKGGIQKPGEERR